jgi:uncharacterized protein YcbX
MMLTIASLHIYPIKSLGGFSVKEARTTDRGFEHDRRWMLVNENGRFITQREAPSMACLHSSILADGFRITEIRDGAVIDLPWEIRSSPRRQATVFADTVAVLDAPADVSAWFANKLQLPCALVFMPEDSKRSVDPTFAIGINSLSDGFPYLIVSQASLDDLNERIPSADPLIGTSAHLPMDRFRPNIVIAGGQAFQEDGWKEIMIGDAHFSLVKPCARCAIPTIDQRTSERGMEPTRTLASYRKRVTSQGGVKVEFGMNAMAVPDVTLRIGDPVLP